MWTRPVLRRSSSGAAVPAIPTEKEVPPMEKKTEMIEKGNATTEQNEEEEGEGETHNRSSAYPFISPPQGGGDFKTEVTSFLLSHNASLASLREFVCAAAHIPLSSVSSPPAASFESSSLSQHMHTPQQDQQQPLEPLGARERSIPFEFDVVALLDYSATAGAALLQDPQNALQIIEKEVLPPVCERLLKELQRQRREQKEKLSSQISQHLQTQGSQEHVLYQNPLSLLEPQQQQHHQPTAEEAEEQLLLQAAPQLIVRLVHIPRDLHIEKAAVSDIRSADVGQLVCLTGRIIRTGLIHLLEEERTLCCRKCGFTFRVKASPALHYQLDIPSRCPRGREAAWRRASDSTASQAFSNISEEEDDDDGERDDEANDDNSDLSEGNRHGKNFLPVPPRQRPGENDPSLEHNTSLFPGSSTLFFNSDARSDWNNNSNSTRRGREKKNEIRRGRGGAASGTSDGGGASGGGCAGMRSHQRWVSVGNRKTKWTKNRKFFFFRQKKQSCYDGCDGDAFDLVGEPCRSDYQEIRLHCTGEEALATAAASSRFAAARSLLSVVLLKDLAGRFAPGETATVVGFVRHRWPRLHMFSRCELELFVEANNCFSAPSTPEVSLLLLSPAYASLRLRAAAVLQFFQEKQQQQQQHHQQQQQQQLVENQQLEQQPPHSRRLTLLQLFAAFWYCVRSSSNSSSRRVSTSNRISPRSTILSSSTNTFRGDSHNSVSPYYSTGNSRFLGNSDSNSSSSSINTFRGINNNSNSSTGKSNNSTTRTTTVDSEEYEAEKEEEENGGVSEQQLEEWDEWRARAMLVAAACPSLHGLAAAKLAILLTLISGCEPRAVATEIPFEKEFDERSRSSKGGLSPFSSQDTAEVSSAGPGAGDAFEQIRGQHETLRQEEEQGSRTSTMGSYSRHSREGEREVYDQQQKTRHHQQLLRVQLEEGKYHQTVHQQGREQQRQQPVMKENQRFYSRWSKYQQRYISAAAGFDSHHHHHRQQQQTKKKKQKEEDEDEEEEQKQEEDEAGGGFFHKGKHTATTPTGEATKENKEAMIATASGVLFVAPPSTTNSAAGENPPSSTSPKRPSSPSSSTTSSFSSSSSSSFSPFSFSPEAAADDEFMTSRQLSHMLLIGSSGTGKSFLLKAAAALASKSVAASGPGCSAAGLTCAATRDAATGEWQLEAGALVLANNGVCCLDDFHLIKKDAQASIHEAMEQQSVSVAKVGLVTRLRARCSVVAALHSSKRCGGSSSSRSLFTFINRCSSRRRGQERNYQGHEEEGGSYLNEGITTPKDASALAAGAALPEQNIPEEICCVDAGLPLPLLSRFDIIAVLDDAATATEAAADLLLQEVTAPAVRDDAPPFPFPELPSSNSSTRSSNNNSTSGTSCSNGYSVVQSFAAEFPWTLEMLRAYISVVKNSFYPGLSSDAERVLCRYYERLRCLLSSPSTSSNFALSASLSCFSSLFSSTTFTYSSQKESPISSSISLSATQLPVPAREERRPWQAGISVSSDGKSMSASGPSREVNRRHRYLPARAADSRYTRARRSVASSEARDAQESDGEKEMETDRNIEINFGALEHISGNIGGVGGGGGGGACTLRFFESLIRLSQAHARLMWRREVKRKDAVAVIWLLETCLSGYRVVPALKKNKDDELPEGRQGLLLTVQPTRTMEVIAELSAAARVHTQQQQEQYQQGNREADEVERTWLQEPSKCGGPSGSAHVAGAPPRRQNQPTTLQMKSSNTLGGTTMGGVAPAASVHCDIRSAAEYEAVEALVLKALGLQRKRRVSPTVAVSAAVKGPFLAGEKTVKMAAEQMYRADKPVKSEARWTPASQGISQHIVNNPEFQIQSGPTLSSSLKPFGAATQFSDSARQPLHMNKSNSEDSGMARAGDTRRCSLGYTSGDDTGEGSYRGLLSSYSSTNSIVNDSTRGSILHERYSRGHAGTPSACERGPVCNDKTGGAILSGFNTSSGVYTSSSGSNLGQNDCRVASIKPMEYKPSENIKAPPRGATLPKRTWNFT